MDGEHSGSEHTEADRRDQAMGRLIQLLPMLSVKELDALADRIGRWKQGSPGASIGPNMGRRATDWNFLSSGVRAVGASDAAVDMVGH